MNKHGSKKLVNEKDIRTTRRVAKNSLFLLISRSFGISTVVITFALIARYLGTELFGFYAVVTAISITLRPLADFGFERIICREISKRKDDADLYLNTTIIVRITFSTILFLSTLILLKAFSPWNRDINIAVMIAIVTELIMSMNATFLSVMRAFERMEFELLANIAHKLAYLSFILAVILFDFGFLAIFYARFIASVIYIL